MKKSEAMALVDKYSMNPLIKDVLTKQIVGWWVRSKTLLPELDALADQDELNNVMAERIEEGGIYLYRLLCPKSWMRLSGWEIDL